MRYSTLFGKTKKVGRKLQNVSLHTQILTKAGFIRQYVAGSYFYLPLGWRVLKKVENIIREEMDCIGAQEILMPILHSAKEWKHTGRWYTTDTLFRFKSYFGKQELALGSTHEEIVTPLVKSFVLSYRDLPVALYQIHTKFRDERRPTLGLTRLREFRMKDLYSFHANKEDMYNYYEVVKEAYWKIITRVGLRDVTYLTLASGGDFTDQYSHEFQAVVPNGQDLIYHCQRCNKTYNKEVVPVKKGNNCPECKGRYKVMRALEIANIFPNLKFSKAFDFYFTDKDGKKKIVYMGCYGMGPDRLVSAIVESNADKKGIIWPVSVAPYHVHLFSVEIHDNLRKAANSLHDLLESEGIEVLWDDRSDVSAGVKFSDADLIGIPIRIVISKRSLSEGGVEIKLRNEEKTSVVKTDKIVEHIKCLMSRLKALPKKERR